MESLWQQVEELQEEDSRPLYIKEGEQEREYDSTLCKKKY